jgi:hypothetical protein
MHSAFRSGFEKVATDLHRFSGDTPPQVKTKFDWKPTAVFAGAGALGGIADALVSSKPSLKRGLLLTGIGTTMGALEGTRQGKDAPTWRRAAQVGTAAALGGGTAFVMSHGLSNQKRLAATALGAIASGMTSSL